MSCLSWSGGSLVLVLLGGRHAHLRALPRPRECLAYALDLPDEAHGVWGGLTLEERRTLARRQSVTDERLSQTA